MTTHLARWTLVSLIAAAGCSHAQPPRESHARLPGTGPGTPAEAFEKLKAAAISWDLPAATALLAEGALIGFSGEPFTTENLEGFLPMMQDFTYRETVLAPARLPDLDPTHLRDKDPGTVAFVHLTANHPMGRMVVRLAFLRQADIWKLYPIGMEGFEMWPSSGGEERAILSSLGNAIQYHDWRSMFEHIDPEMRKGVRPEDFQAEVLRRYDELIRRTTRDDPMPPPPDMAVLTGQTAPASDEYEEVQDKRRMEFNAWRERQTAREQAETDFIAWHRFPAEGHQRREITENGRQIVELSKGDDSERFVIIDGRWYWQPKKEYTLWPYLKYEGN